MGSNKDKARWCPETREEAMGTNLKKKKKSVQTKESHFYCDGRQVLQEVSQRGCRISILGDTENPAGHGPGQSALGGLALSRGVGPDYLKDSFQLQPFQDSEIQHVFQKYPINNSLSRLNK